MKRVLDTPSIAGDKTFSVDLIAWQKKHGRHQLPWQNTRDPYRIWLSEIMLQQTQVTAVIPYYLRFLSRFDSVSALAHAPVEEVMAYWSGLGYYTRARNLHRCAQQIMTQHGGVFPSDPEQLVQLPGIGRSTAAAIAAFAFGARAAILDGNVKRVFCRVFGIEGYPGEKRIENMLWERAESLMPPRSVEAYTQGLMDLGATVCVRSRPLCPQCPMQSRCIAAATGRTASLPARKPKKTIPEKSTVMLVVIHKGVVLLEQRPAQGIWGGLLSLPELSRVMPLGSDTISRRSMQRALRDFGELDTWELLPVFSHGFTHYKLHIQPVYLSLKKRTTLAAQAEFSWVSLQDIANAALPAPVKKLLLKLEVN
jgi:A/G-specific adenine glycosylase